MIQGRPDNSQATGKPEHPAIEVCDLHRSLGTIEVLKGISLTATRGDMIAMRGSSGSCTSTFLRCINLLETPDSGVGRVDGEEILMMRNRRGEPVPKDKRQVDRIRSRLGMLFQQFSLWLRMTVLQNVVEAPIHLLGRPRQMALDQATGILRKIGFGDRTDSYRAHLSGGQQVLTLPSRSGVFSQADPDRIISGIRINAGKVPFLPGSMSVRSVIAAAIPPLDRTLECLPDPVWR